MHASDMCIQGDTLASCDSMGVVRLWDVRKNATMMTVKVGPHPANKVAFDPSGQSTDTLGLSDCVFVHVGVGVCGCVCVCV